MPSVTTDSAEQYVIGKVLQNPAYMIHHGGLYMRTRRLCESDRLTPDHSHGTVTYGETDPEGELPTSFQQ